MLGQAPPAAPPAPQTEAPQSAEAPNDLIVTVGKSVVVNSAQPIERVSVGFGDIAEAVAVGPREVLVNGKAPGETSLILWQQGGTKLFFDVTVRPSRTNIETKTEAIRRQIRQELQGQDVQLVMEGDSVFVRGRVKDMNSADRAIMIASALGKPINLLYVDIPPAETQVLLKVRFATLDRSRSVEAGLNLFSTGALNTIGRVTTQQFTPPTLVQNPNQPIQVTFSDALNIFLFRPDLDLGATIRALQQKQIVEVLAEPNVLTTNGKQASFLAGGEFPFPILQGTGGGSGATAAITIQFREYGIRLNFLPTITPRGTIRLQVAPEVSALDFSNGVTLQGFIIPGLTVRKVSTSVELQENQSFAIAGLLDNRVTDLLSKVPVIGDIPILGKLFQSKSYRKQNTELLVMVTPEFVRPIPAGQKLPMISFPIPFMDPNSNIEMRTPGIAVTGAVPFPAAQPVPVETLNDSLKETPLTGVSGVVQTPYNGPQMYVPAMVPASPTPGTGGTGAAAPVATPAPAATTSR